LPLKAFFVLGPLVFLIIHAHVLLHFVLLAGKIGAFGSELRNQIADADLQARLRRQLPSNVFVQALTGPPDVREGMIGFLLRLVIRISLVAAPIALLVLFQLQFLPYHSEWITNWQRAALVIELVLLWLLWPPIARGNTTRLAWHDLGRPKIVAWLLVSFLPVLLAVTIATFPGEWLDENLRSVRLVPTSWRAWTAPSIEAVQKPGSGWATLHELLVAGSVNLVTDSPKSLWSNVLVLPDFKAGDRVKFDAEGKIAIGSDTLSLRGRDLQGAVFARSHLDKTDFTGARLQRANFFEAELHQAKFACDEDGAENRCAQLAGAVFYGAQLPGADLQFAQLAGAHLQYAQLAGAHLFGAQLAGADLGVAQLAGAVLRDAQLAGTDLRYAQLQSAEIDHALVWRATAPSKNDAKDLWGTPLAAAKSLELGCAKPGDTCDWTAASYAALKAMVEREVPAGRSRDVALGQIAVLEKPPDPAADQQIADAWTALADPPLAGPQYLAALAATLQQHFCNANGSADAIAGLTRQLDLRFYDDLAQAAKLAEAFLDEAKCPPAHGLPEAAKAMLRRICHRDRFQLPPELLPPPPPSLGPGAGGASR
jgi:Pentapeptide repeats (8 copies)